MNIFRKNNFEIIFEPKKKIKEQENIDNIKEHEQEHIDTTKEIDKEHSDKTKEKEQIYNYKKQNSDIRDFIYKYQSLELPVHYFIEEGPVFDQEDLGSCLANATKVLINIISNGKINLSRLDLYNKYRLHEGANLEEDCGGSIRSVMKVIKMHGLYDESYWDYNIENFNKLVENSNEEHKIYLRDFKYIFITQELEHIKECLYNNYPILAAFSLYQNFESKETITYGIVKMPEIDEPYLGKHAMLIIGYDDLSKHFKIRNSWGIDWGDTGHCYMPYEYVLNHELSFDLCTVMFEENV